jgi:hypothetical protein
MSKKNFPAKNAANLNLVVEASEWWQAANRLFASPQRHPVKFFNL